MKFASRVIASMLCLVVVACTTTQGPRVNLASARVVSDFDTYTLRRVGLMPINGMDPTLAESRELATMLAAEFAAVTGLEVLVLTPSDLSEVKEMNAHNRGEFNMRTIIEVGKRHRLDGLLVPTLTERNVFPPQRIGLQMDFVATETGMSLWFGNLAADASTKLTQQAVYDWTHNQFSDEHFDDGVVLISPKRFFRFACAQLVERFAKPANQF
ncbi:MAG: hypothetical protein P1V35_14675 [Planctomycetota bacterium]|nr:hypothetical protein [Planctomycetota bacterium]